MVRDIVIVIVMLQGQDVSRWRNQQDKTYWYTRLLNELTWNCDVIDRINKTNKLMLF